MYYAGIFYIAPLTLENTENLTQPTLKSDYAKSIATKSVLEAFIVFLPKIIIIDFLLLFVIYPVLVLFSLLSIRKQFRFYFAQACMKIIADEAISEGKGTVKKTYYLILGLKSYNIFLRRSINLQIQNLKQLYSKIISGYPIDKELTDFLSVAFKDENDKLKAARYLSTFLKDEESILVTEPLSGKIETWGKFAAAIIPVVITVIQFLLGQSSKN